MVAVGIGVKVRNGVQVGKGVKVWVRVGVRVGLGAGVNVRVGVSWVCFNTMGKYCITVAWICARVVSL